MLPFVDFWKQRNLKTGKLSRSLDACALEAFQKGVKLYLGNRQITSIVELLVLNANSLVVDETTCPDCKKPPTARMARTASTAAGLFELDTNSCPHCQSKMQRVVLSGNVSAMYCSSCRHCDYLPQDKSKINAGTPSADKTIRLECQDLGSCRISE